MQTAWDCSCFPCLAQFLSYECVVDCTEAMHLAKSRGPLVSGPFTRTLAVQVPHGQRQKQKRRALLLPEPLYILFTQLLARAQSQAQQDSAGASSQPALEVQVDGSIRDAELVAKHGTLKMGKAPAHKPLNPTTAAPATLSTFLCLMPCLALAPDPNYRCSCHVLTFLCLMPCLAFAIHTIPAALAARPVRWWLS